MDKPKEDDEHDWINFSDLAIEKEIGKGAFGVVWKAKYFGSDVAVKVLSNGTSAPSDPNLNQWNSEEMKKYIKREVAMLKGLRHPNVVMFLGLSRGTEESLSLANQKIYIVTEFVEGGNLRTWLKKTEVPLPWPKRIAWASDIVSALAYLHSKGIIFRDLKSKNVLIEDQKAKLCDFGLARARSKEQVGRPMTMCGTDEWMAPEVILGMEYDTPADVFSYGIVLFELISRQKVSVSLQRLPKDAFGLDEDMAKEIIPPDCPKEFSDIAFKCCEYEPDQRPLSKALVVTFSGLVKKFFPERSVSSPLMLLRANSTPLTDARIQAKKNLNPPTSNDSNNSKNHHNTSQSPPAEARSDSPSPASPPPAASTSVSHFNKSSATSGRFSSLTSGKTTPTRSSNVRATSPTPSSPSPSSKPELPPLATSSATPSSSEKSKSARSTTGNRLFGLPLKMTSSSNSSSNSNKELTSPKNRTISTLGQPSPAASTPKISGRSNSAKAAYGVTKSMTPVTSPANPHKFTSDAAKEKEWVATNETNTVLKPSELKKKLMKDKK